MRQICVSGHSLARISPEGADDARLLLSLIAGAEDLAQLEALSCVTTNRLDGMTLLSLGSVEIKGMLTSATTSTPGQIGQRPPSGSGLVIMTIHVAGRPLARAAEY